MYQIELDHDNDDILCILHKMYGELFKELYYPLDNQAEEQVLDEELQFLDQLFDPIRGQFLDPMVGQLFDPIRDRLIDQIVDQLFDLRKDQHNG